MKCLQSINMNTKRFSIILVALHYAALLTAQRQYDYYDDSAVAGGADRALSGIIFFVLLVVGFIALVILGNIYFKIYYWFNPEKNPEYIARKRREEQEKTKSLKQSQSVNQTKSTVDSAYDNNTNYIVQQTKKEDVVYSDEGFKAYKASFKLTINPESKDVMKDLYSYKMYEGDKLVSAMNGAGTTQRSYDINPKEGTRIICDFAYDDYERRFERSIVIPNSVVAIGDNAFEYLHLDEVTLPSSVKYITGNPFGSFCKKISCLSSRFSFENGCLLSQEQSLLIADLRDGEKIKKTPKGIKYIGRGAYKLHDLQVIRIDSSVVAISDFAFGGSNLRAIIFEGKPKIVEESIFKRCTNLKAIYVPQNTLDYFREILPKEYFKCLVEMEREEITDNEIIRKIAISEDGQNQKVSSTKGSTPKAVDITKEQMAYLAKEKKDYILSKGTEIDYAHKVIDWGAHENEEHESYDCGDAIYSADGKKLLELYCEESNYIIKNGTEVICDAAFQGASRDIIVSFPSSIKILGNNLYWGAERDAFEIPSSVQKITGNPFATCEGSIDNKSPYFVYEKGVLYDKSKSKVLSVMWNSQDEDMYIDPKVIIIGRSAFYDRHLYDTKLLFPPNLRYIGDWAFASSYMSDYLLSEAIVEIGDNAFCQSNIKQAHLPSLRKLGKEAFSSCRNLESLVLSSSLVTIEKDTFYSCEKLKKVIIPEGVRILKTRCFHFCKNLEEVYLPNSLERIETDAFGATKLLSVVVSKGTVIEEDAFPHNCDIIYRD